MGASKEAYIREVERLCALGMDYDRAGQAAYESYGESLLERADNERKRMKEEGVRPKEQK